MLPFKNQKTQTSEIYFAIELSFEIVKAATWKIKDQEVEVLKVSEAISVENHKPESILNAVDMAIATISDELLKDPEKIIFGLPEDWVGEEGIIQDKRQLLKFLCQKLELKPLGFVVVQDALVTYLKKQQGTPPNTIFVRFCEKELIITLVKLGKIEKLEKVNRSDDPISDIKEGLARFKKTTQLPAQITLYNSHTDFEDIRQQLLGASLEEKFPFLHTPRIDSLISETTIKAVAIAGGTEVAKSMIENNLKQEEKAETIEKPQILKDEITEEDKTTVLSETSDKTTVLSETSDKSEDLPEGFVIGDSNLDETDLKEEKSETIEKPEILESSTNLEADSEIENLEIESDLNQETKEPILKPKSPKTNFIKKIIPFFKNIKIKLPKTKKDENTFNIPKSPKVKIVFVILAIIIILGGLFTYAYWFYYNKPKAQITLYITPQNIAKDVDIKVSTVAQSLDLDNFIVPASFQETSINGTETIDTTGVKKIGEKAKGKVLIYNKTDKKKSFAKNTILIGPGNLRYILNEDIDVASQSAKDTGGGAQITYGSAETEIVAGDIGEGYNLPVDSVFSFKDLNESNYSAKAKAEISGGSSQEIQVVSKEDQQEAKKILEKKLILEAQQQIKDQKSDEIVFFEDIVESKLSNSTFDQEVGAETQKLTITGDLDLKILASSKKDFNTIVEKTLQSVIPSEFVVSSNSLNYNILEKLPDEKPKTTSKTKEETVITTYNFRISAQASLMPKLDFTNIKKSILGKYPSKAEEYFRSIPNYSKVSITISPVLPAQFQTIPRKTENIVITVQEDK